MSGPRHNRQQTTPLDEIRQAEAAVAARILIARQQAKQDKDIAKNQAVAILEQAEQSGARDGQIQRDHQVGQARQEAERLSVDAQSQAEDLQARCQGKFEEAVRWAVNLVLGQEEQAP